MTLLSNTRQILLADDDRDDSVLFGDALAEFPIPVNLAVVYDGERLIQLLKEVPQLPDLLFLDLNMPLKNGMECLAEIKQTKRLQSIPVIIFSTSYEVVVINQLYLIGAHYYIQKPNSFTAFKNVIVQALTLTEDVNNAQPPRNNFELLS